jgi:hypothetical protein
MSEPVKLLTTRSDAAIATDIKNALADQLAKVCELMDAGQDAGLTVHFSIGKDGRYRNIISALTVIKVL